MKRVPKPFLPFKLEMTLKELNVTSHGGLPHVLEVIRFALDRRTLKNLAKSLGYRSWKTVRRHLESLLLLIAAGGDCIDDLTTLRGDKGLEKLLGFRLSSPSAAKEFLYAFDQDEKGRRLSPEESASRSVQGTAVIREEGPALKILRELVSQLLTRMADVDHVIFAVSAPVGGDIEGCMQAIPEPKWGDYLSLDRSQPGDSGATLPQDKVPLDPGDAPDSTAEIRQWAEIPDFVPNWKRNFKKSTRPFRYIAIRVRNREKDILDPQRNKWRHFAVVTNDCERSGLDILVWHREKQGTVEHGHGDQQHPGAAVVARARQVPCFSS